MLVFFLFFLIYTFIADKISISMYIMRVILCVFSTLSRMVGALQISIIIIIIIIIIVVVVVVVVVVPVTRLPVNIFYFWWHNMILHSLIVLFLVALHQLHNVVPVDTFWVHYTNYVT